MSALGKYRSEMNEC